VGVAAGAVLAAREEVPGALEGEELGELAIEVLAPLVPARDDPGSPGLDLEVELGARAGGAVTAHRPHRLEHRSA